MVSWRRWILVVKLKFKLRHDLRCDRFRGCLQGAWMLLSVFSAVALRADAPGGHCLQNQAGCHRFDEDIGATDINIASCTTPACQHLAQQRLVETSVEVFRTMARLARCRHDK